MSATRAARSKTRARSLAAASLLLLHACSVDLSSIPVAEDVSIAARDGGRDGAALDSGRDSGSSSECLTAARGERCGLDGLKICLEGRCVTSTCGDGFIDSDLEEECEGSDGGEQECVRCKHCVGDACDVSVPDLCPGGRMKLAELCNGEDDDCDGETDEDVVQMLYVDADGDGYGRTDMPVPGCDLAEGLAYQADDCKDDDDAIHPGATEACNGEDDDCDGEIDLGCACTDGEEIACGARNGSGDLITDGLCVSGVQVCEGGMRGSCVGSVLPTDELCDGVNDEDCDGSVDEHLLTDCWPDADGDGYAQAGAAVVSACLSECPSGETDREPAGEDVDCDDASDQASPAITEICNGVDDDCDGDTDEGLLTTYYRDADADGYGNSSMSMLACAAPAGYVAAGGDCRDDSAAIKPGVTEVCDAVDNDCNGAADDGIPCACTNGSTRPCGPSNGQGGIETRGECAAGTQTCTSGSYGTCVGDVSPSAEVCDGSKDEDCDGVVDEMLGRACWTDADGDGFAPSGANMITVCGNCPSGRTATQPTGTAVDCNDGDGAVYPGRSEVCNGKDDNCVGGTDEGFDVGTACGTGACAGGVRECATTSSTRCASMPGGSSNQASAETCNGDDDDCDNVTDENVTIACWADPDGDGFAASGAAMTSACGSCGSGRTATAPTGTNIDCNGSSGAIYPGRSELCNGIDDNCAGGIDEGFNLGAACGSGACAGGVRECATTTTTRCSREAGGSDSRVTTETCNGVDDNCAGGVDEGFGIGAACGTGRCAGGVTECATPSTTRCSTTPGGSSNQAIVETCNGVNDDCDGATDENINAYCQTNNELRTCTGGSFQPSFCAASNKSCINTIVQGVAVGACGGACAHGRWRCTSSVQPQECDVGVWENRTACTSVQRCDADAPNSPTYGTCVANPQELFGKNDTSASTLDLENDAIYAQPIRLPWAATLEELGMRTTNTSNLGRAYVALYTDNGSGTGAPATLINHTAEISLVQNDVNARPPFNQTPAALSLAANTRYWIVAYVREGSGNFARVYLDTAPGSEGHYRAGNRAFGTPVTSLSTTTTFVQTGEISIWIKVRR